MFTTALATVFQPSNLLYILVGTLGGTLIGALPGMTSNMLLAIFLPFTFKMDAVGATIMMVAICQGANYGGGITAILFNTPGTPAAAATALDGFPMSKQGRAGEALLATAFSSFIGGTIAWLIMIVAAPLIAKFALLFGPCEYAMLMIWSICIIAMLTGKDPLKGILAGVFGLALSTIGMEPYLARLRFTFGSVELYSGIDITQACVGVFCIVQMIKYVKMSDTSISVDTDMSKIKWPVRDTLKKMLQSWKNLIKSTVIGTFIGAAPGAGPVIASFLAYGQAKSSSKDPDSFGKGNIDGVIASESSNNACAYGAMVPMLSLGVPGSTATAIMMAGMIIVGLTPGPEFFTKYTQEAYSIFTGSFLANILFLIIGLTAVKYIIKLVQIKVSYIIPLVIMLATIGVYAPSNSIFGIYVMFAFGIIGLIMDATDFPVMPMILGLILGGIMEKNFVRAMIMTRNNFLKITGYSPICIFLTVATIVTILAVIIKPLIKKRKAPITTVEDDD